jgi:hypothetical protein
MASASSGCYVLHPAIVRGPVRGEPEVGPARDDESPGGGRMLPRVCPDLRLPLCLGLPHQRRWRRFCGFLEAPERLSSRSSVLRETPRRSATAFVEPFARVRRNFHLGSRGFRRGTGEHGVLRLYQGIEDLGAPPGRRRRGVVAHAGMKSDLPCGQRPAAGPAPSGRTRL